MQMNTNIPMAGQSPDFMNILSASNDAAQNFNNYRRQNALADYVQQNGAGMLAGNANALAGYANYDPAGAIDMQGAQQQQRQSAAQDARLSAAEQRNIEEHAASMSAADRQAQAAKIEQTVAQALAAPSAQAWDAIVGQIAPDLVGQFDNRETVAARYMSIADVLKRQDAAAAANAPANPADRYHEVGGNVWDYGDGTSPPAMLPGQGEAMTVYGPDGQPIMTQGTGGAGRPLTEAQGKDNMFSTQARGALDALNPVVNTLTSRWDQTLGAVPFGLGGGGQDQNYQVANQAGQEFLSAILRKVSGAAITEQEQALYGRIYLPQPGDQPAVVEAKALARERAVAGIESGMTPIQLAARDGALVQAALANGSAPPATGAAPASDPALTPVTGTAPPALTMEMVSRMTSAQLESLNLTPEQLRGLPDDVFTAMMARIQ